MTYDLTSIVEAIGALLIAVVTCILIPWIRSKTTNEKQKQIQGYYDIFVLAAEQLYKAGRGKEKLNYVMQKLFEKGIKIDQDMIEATVYRLLNSFKLEEIAATTEPENK